MGNQREPEDDHQREEDAPKPDLLLGAAARPSAVVTSGEYLKAGRSWRLAALREGLERRDSVWD